ncbi:MAG: dephospho-CoA kinase, partial [Alistipes sp.]|nr:dephospho-CoA kinase [Alistipes sp.]
CVGAPCRYGRFRGVGRAADESDYVILESAILFEAAIESHVDRTIAVMSPEPLRRARAMARDGAGEQAVRSRMACQISDDEMRRRADWAMINIDLDELREEVAQCDKKLRYEASRYGNRS